MSETKFITEGNKLTVTRTFNAPVEIVWRTWTEAKLLDLWWAPKPWKSQTKKMNFKEGGNRLYAMCSPEGEKHWGLTTYKSIINKHLEFIGEDAFCDNEGVVNKEFPIAEFQNIFEENSNSTIVTVITQYASEEHLKQVVQMGMKEGLTMAYNNLDNVLNKLELI